MTPSTFSIGLAMGVFTLGALIAAAEERVVFEDRFDRADAPTIGADWQSKGKVVLKDNAVWFLAKEEEFRPRTQSRFPKQEGGQFTVSFLMDWMRESEGTWAFYMQLGDSETMAERLVYLDDLAKGIGVNLVWGGGDLVDGQPRGSLGYRHNGTFNPLSVVNDTQSPESVVEDPTVTIGINLDTGVYSVEVNKHSYANLPLGVSGPIDTIRFIANGCSATGFSRTSIDNVLITTGP